MRQFAIYIIISVQLFLVSAAWATRTEIVGKSKAGQSFNFMYGFGDIPELDDPRLPPNTIPEPNTLSGVQVSAQRTKNSSEIYNETQCIMFSTKIALFLSCAAQPKNALSGIVYQYKGMNKSGDGMYSCITGCSDHAPRSLLEVSLPGD